MRPVFLTHCGRSARQKPSTFGLKFGACLLALWFVSLVFAAFCIASPDPMQDEASQSVRQGFAHCRNLASPTEQYFCTCEILANQCEAPRKLEHGDWNTVEYWPSENEEDREVQFVLFASYDLLGESLPVDAGMVLTCIAGHAELNIFVGNDVNADFSPIISAGGQKFEAQFNNTDGEYLISLDDTAPLYEAMLNAKRLDIDFEKSNGSNVVAEFQIFGFEAVTIGWEKLCTSNPS